MWREDLESQRYASADNAGKTANLYNQGSHFCQSRTPFYSQSILFVKGKASPQFNPSI